MLHVVIPCAEGRPLPFFLAAEEWIAAHMPAGESYFMWWRVAPTVICGRNQDMAAEVDTDFCRRRGIEVWRRKSGGGAVYADAGNIMFSYIGPRTSVQEAFDAYTSRVAGALQALGLNAVAGGRNDICIDGRKVAGNAFMQASGRNIVHGTMLFEADEEAMLGALTPERAKLESHKVRSVPARIISVRSLLPDLSLGDFVGHIVSHVCDGETRLPDDALAGIERIETEYRRPEFRFGGRTRPSRSAAAGRIEGVGRLAPRVTVSDGLIDSIALEGDFFSGEALDVALRALQGLPPEAAALSEALGDEPLITGLPNDRLARLIAEAATG